MNRPFKEYIKHKEYPFPMKGFEVVERTHFLGKVRQELNVGTQEVLELATVIDQPNKVIDNRQFVKMYDDGLSVLLSLNKPALTLLVYILRNLPIGGFEIEIDREKVGRENKSLQREVFYKAVKTLLEYGVIARKDCRAPIYFVNMNCFFNGDRRKGRKKIVKNG